MAVPGVEVAAFLPDEVQLVSTYTAALTPRGARNPHAVAFLAQLTAAKDVFKAEGFD